MYNIETVTDEVEKAVAKTQIDQAGTLCPFESLRGTVILALLCLPECYLLLLLVAARCCPDVTCYSITHQFIGCSTRFHVAFSFPLEIQIV